VTTLLLTPSLGLGGGIERYASTLERAFAHCGESVQVLPLARPSPITLGRARFTCAVLRASLYRRPTLLVAAHLGLLPVLFVASFLAPRARVVLILHGAEIWGGMRPSRRLLIRHWKRLQLVTVSSFSAGAVSMMGRDSAVIRPALEPQWLEMLQAASQPHAQRDVDLLSVFRLSDWREKGAAELLEAHAALAASRPLRTVLAGKGPIPEGLAESAERSGVEITCDLTDAKLAELYGRTKVFLLATRLQTGAIPSGEGFGIVLIEAQAAGACVVAPASGGSSDAIDEGVTGWRRPPSTSALINLINSLLDEDHSRAATEFVARRFTQRRLMEEVKSFFMA